MIALLDYVVEVVVVQKRSDGIVFTEEPRVVSQV